MTEIEDLCRHIQRCEIRYFHELIFSLTDDTFDFPSKLDADSFRSNREKYLEAVVQHADFFNHLVDSYIVGR